MTKPYRRTRGSTNPRQWLKNRAGRWHVQVSVPRTLRSVVGCATMERALGTSDLAEANARKFAVIAEFRETIARARRDPAAFRSSPESVAQSLRKHVEAVRAGGDEELSEHLDIVVSDYLERLEQQVGTEAAHRASKVIFSREKSLADHMTAFNAASGKPSTHLIRDQALRSLLDFAKAPGLLPSELTPELCVRWADSMARAGLAGNTRKSRVAMIGALWAWMQSKLIVPAGPSPTAVVRHDQPHSRGKRGQARRPFTFAEINTLLRGDPPPGEIPHLLRDVLTVALVTGARESEIVALTKDDLEETPEATWLHIRQSKTASGVRQLPVIHGAVRELLRRRAASPGGKLFDHFYGNPAAVSKRFSAFRMRMIGAESPTDLHSARRWAASMGEQNGADPMALMRYLGHKPGGIISVYTKHASRASLLAVAACIPDVTKPLEA